MCIRRFKVSKITFIHLYGAIQRESTRWSLKYFNLHEENIFFYFLLHFSYPFSYKNFYLTKPSIPLSQSLLKFSVVVYIIILFFFVSFGLTFFLFFFFSCFANKLMVAVCWKILFNYLIFSFVCFLKFPRSRIHCTLKHEIMLEILTKCKVITVLSPLLN